MTDRFQPKHNRKQFNYKVLLWVFVTIVFVSIIITATLKILTPQNNTQPLVILPPASFTNYDGSNTMYAGIEFLGPNDYEELIGKQFEIFSIEQTDAEAQLKEVVTRLVNNLNLALAETLFGVEYYRSTETELIVNYKTNKATLTIRPNLTQNSRDLDTNLSPMASESSYKSTFASKMTLSQATIVAQNYLNGILPDSNFEPIPTSASYYRGELHLESVEPELAEYVEVPFAQVINQVPVLIGQSVYEPIRIMVNSRGKVQKATIYPFSLSPQPISLAPLLSVEQTIDQINQNQLASIIYAQQQDVFPYSTENIISGRMNSVKLEYRFDPNSMKLFPHYRFFGSITNQNNDTLSVEILAPAIKVELFQPEVVQ